VVYPGLSCCSTTPLTLPSPPASGGRGDFLVGVSIHHHKRARRKRSAFVITSTELMLIAALAIIGLSNRPKAG
jgi:hypothetical protein